MLPLILTIKALHCLFVCSLDADGAYDGIPHPILLKKAIDIIPDHNWKLLHNWYCNITVKVKWNKIGDSINVCKGTRQGGLTSCLIHQHIHYYNCYL